MGSTVVGAIFRCETCGKVWEEYITAQDAARSHASDTGHRVVGEVTRYFTYGRDPGGNRG